MARRKATVKTTEKVADIAVKTTAPKAEEKKAEVKKAEAAEVKTTETVKETAKAAGEKAERKTRTRQVPAKKAELKSELYLQFAGKSYTQDELLKMARDVWKYDLKQKVRELKGVELYVKPEENIVYYVMNKEFTGSFYI
jgi:hypothetical protein